MAKAAYLSMVGLVWFALSGASPGAKPAAADEPLVGLPYGTVKLSADTKLWSLFPNKRIAVGTDAWDVEPRLGSGLVTWMHDNGHHWVLCALAPEHEDRRLIDTGANAVRPDIGDGLMAWSGADGRTWQIFVSRAGEAPVQITHGRYACRTLRVSNGRVVWFEEDAPGAPIYLWDSQTGETKQLTDGKPQGGPAAFEGDELVWMGKQGAYFQIFYLNLRTGERRQLTDGNVNHRLPSISQGLIAWEAGDGDAAEIYFLDQLHRVRRITTNNCADRLVDVGRGILTWVRYGAGGGVMVCDATAEPLVTFQITNAVGDEYNPRADGSWLVWNQAEPMASAQPEALKEETGPVPARTRRPTRPRQSVYLLPDLTLYCKIARIAQALASGGGQLRREVDAAFTALEMGGAGCDDVARRHLQKVLAGTTSGRAHELTAEVLRMMGTAT